MAEISRVGPKGYIHGWIHVGGPVTGGKVFHPVHGHGTVTGSSGGHVTVAFPGGERTFESRPGPGPGRLEPRTSPERVTGANGALQSSLNPAQRQELRAGAKAAKKRLSPAQAKTVEQWTAGKGMVRRIQQGTVSDATAKAFDAAMREAPKVSGLVYRGVAPGSHGEKIADGLHAGSVMNLDEPVSTSIDPSQAVSFGNTLYEIETPAASYISGIGSGYAYEQEAVMAPGRFEVVSVETGKINYRRAGKTGPVRIIRLRDVTAGARSWQPTAAGKAAAASRAEAAAAGDGDRADRFMAGDGLGQFKLPPGKPPSAVRSSDLKYGPGSHLWEYWTKGDGLAKWSGAAHKWTALRDLLLAAGVPAGMADGLTTNIIQAVMPGYMKQAHAAEKHAGRAAMATDTKAEPYGDVAYADSKNGKYPIDTAAHAKSAWSYVNMPKNAAQYPMNGVTLSEVKDRIMAACKKFGIDVSSDTSSASRADPVYFRTYELEDIHIVRTAQGDSTGRLVEAYATAFNAPAEIQDFEGHYIEEIDPAAFNKVLADIGRSRAGFGKVKVMYNHGMTIHGTPSERGSMPIATPVDIRPEARGLLTLARYSDTPFADEVLENIRNGSITAQSFTGRIVRSDPQLRNGDRHRPRGGQLPRVRRTELGLKEFGPTPFEAYSGAEILGVRMSTPGACGDPEPDEQHDEALPPDGEAAAGEPLTRTDGDVDEHSARYHQHALYVLRAKEAREKAGLVW